MYPIPSPNKMYQTNQVQVFLILFNGYIQFPVIIHYTGERQMEHYTGMQADQLNLTMEITASKLLMVLDLHYLMKTGWVH